MKRGLMLLFVAMLVFVLTGCDYIYIYHYKERGVIVGSHTDTIYVTPQPQPQPLPGEEGHSGIEGNSGKDKVAADRVGDKPCLLTVQTIADYPPGPVTPDQVLIDNGVWKNGLRYDWGEHSYQVAKSGYRTMSGKLTVPKEITQYTYTVNIRTEDRVIRFNITDASTGSKINPDKVTIGDQQIFDGARKKPGIYRLAIHKAGYQSVIESSYDIPVGDGEFVITKTMKSAAVQLRFNITDAETGASLQADKIYLDRKLTSDGSYTQPGTYELSIFKAGYRALKDDQVAIPDVRLHTIARKLGRFAITLRWQITNDYPGVEFSPEVVMVAGKKMQQGDQISPGSHDVIIQDPAYESLRKSIVVPDDVPEYILKGQMISLPRLVEQAIVYDVEPFTSEQSMKLGPCRVSMRNTVNEIRYDIVPGIKIKPATYELTIKRTAYHPVNDRVRVMPGLQPYKIDKELLAKDRVVQVDVTFDIEPSQDLAIHAVDFIGRIRRRVPPGGTIKPGKYDYQVIKDGYKMTGQEKRPIVIEPDESPFLIKARLEALPRKITFDITLNEVAIKPDQVLVNGKPYRFTSLLPGEYQVAIKFQEYETIQKTITVPPGVGDHVVKVSVTPK